MNKFTLNYIEPKLEKKYNVDLATNQRRKMTTLIIVENFFIIIFELYFLLFIGQSIKHYLFLIEGIVLILLCVLISKYYPAGLFFFIHINVLCLIIYFVELIKAYQKDFEFNPNLMVMIIPLQKLLSLMISTKFKWFICSLAYLGSMVYLFFRTIDLYETNSRPTAPTVVLTLALSWLIYTILAYDYEKSFRHFFQKNDESFQKVNYFKSILEKVMPSPIFIVDWKNSKVKFINNAAFVALDLIDKSPEHHSAFQKLKDFFKKFTIYRNNENSINLNEIQSPNIEINIHENNNNDPIAFITNYMENPMEIPLNDMGTESSESLRIFNISADCLINLSKSHEINEEIFDNNSLKYHFEVKIIKVLFEESICVMIILNETTNIFRISELMSLNNYKNQLLASVSHDLRTPLNGINGMLEISIEKTTDLEVLSHLNMAKTSTKFLNFLINDILDFSLMSFKQMRLKLEKIDFFSILQEMQNLFEYQARSKKIELKISCMCASFQEIFSDSRRICQILLNLLSNALKFTQKGFIELILEEIKDCDDFMYKFSVRDTGIGIKQEDICKLFCLFGRLEAHKKINKTGIGLGLTISNKIAKLLCPSKPKGIEIQSVYGDGSTFSFYVSSLNAKNLEKMQISFEMDKQKEENEKNEEEKQQFSTKLPISKTFQSLISLEEKSLLALKRKSSSLNFENYKNKKVLIVDDDLLSLNIIEGYLKYFNLESEKAMDGLEAYHAIKNSIKFKQIEIFFIIMDCNMPIVDGFQASAKINKYLKKHQIKKIPILAMTANLTVAKKKLIMSCGIDYLLEKPLAREDLRNILRIFAKEQ